MVGVYVDLKVVDQGRSQLGNEFSGPIFNIKVFFGGSTERFNVHDFSCF